MSIVEEIKQKISEELVNSLEKNKELGNLDFSNIPEFVVEVPREEENGDFASNISLVMAKEARNNPRKIAELVVENFTTEFKWLEKIEIAGPGFINFFLNSSWLYDVLVKAEKEDEDYGRSNFGQEEKVQVEFISANPTGLLHMGNARGGALGDSLSNVLDFAGYQVEKEFYINDAGNQIENFGKSLEARYQQELGVDFPFPEEGYHGVDIIDTVKRIMARDGEKLKEMSAEQRFGFLIENALNEKITAIKGDLENFGVSYDVWFSEKSLHESGAVKETVEILEEKGLVYEKEGALWLKTSEICADEKDEVLVRSNGLPTYFAADIAYHRNKFERGFTKVINIWGADHHGHVERMKGAMKALGYNPDNLTVILMQLVRLYRGEEVVRMSKRTGQYVTLNELISEVGKDAARYFFVMRNPDSHLEFDLELAKKESNENPVYYVQYAHARICSILQMREKDLASAGDLDLTILKEKEELDLIRKIADLPDEIVQAARLLEPHRLTHYAHELASAFHSFYNSCRVLVDDEDLKDARLALVNATRIALRNVLSILGVSAPERM